MSEVLNKIFSTVWSAIAIIGTLISAIAAIAVTTNKVNRNEKRSRENKILIDNVKEVTIRIESKLDLIIQLLEKE